MATTYTRKDSKGRRYRLIDFTPKGGKRVRRSLGPIRKMSHIEARIAAGAKDYEVRTGKPVFTPAPLFENFRTRYLEWRAGKYPRSQVRVAQILKSDHMDVFVGHVMSDPDLVQIIDLWQVRRLKSVSNNSMVKEFRQLHAMFQKEIEWNHRLTENPCNGAEQVKEKKRKGRIAHTSQQARRMYARERHGAKWRLMYNTGLRRAEALHAQVDWFNLEKKELTIESQDEDEETPRVRVVKGRGRTAQLDREGWEPKSGHSRVVPLNDQAIAAFHSLMRGREGQANDFPSIKGRGLSKAFSRDLKACALKGSLKCTRHTYATHLAEAGVPIPTIQKLLGHRDIKTTMIYAETSQEHARKLAAKVAV
jgi:integrase